MHRLRLLRALIWHLLPWARWAYFSRSPWLAHRNTKIEEWHRGTIRQPATVEIPPRHAGTFLMGIDPGRDDPHIDLVHAFDGIDRSVLEGPALTSFRAGLDRDQGAPLTLDDARRIVEDMRRGRR
jgi:hypothetical protein